MLLLAFAVLAQVNGMSSMDAKPLEASAATDRPSVAEYQIITEPVNLATPWKDDASFYGCTFSQEASFNGFEKTANFHGGAFEGAAEFKGEFKGPVIFNGVEFRNHVRFAHTQFRDDLLLWGVQFINEAGVFTDVDFHGPVTVVQPKGKALLFIGTFHGDAEFRDFQVNEIRFSRVTFDGRTSFVDPALRDLSIEECIFTREPDFNRTAFVGNVSFAGSTFKQGLDLRFADFSNARQVILEQIRVDPRQFRVSWSAIQGKLDVTRRDGMPGQAWFPRLEATYHIVAAALKAQDNDDDAEQVLHELEDRRQQVFGGFWHRLYGVFLGYGFAPWRVVFLVIPMIAVFALLLIPHRETVATILDDDIKKGTIAQSNVSKPARIAHLLFFSTAVLLGIRFKQEWIQPANTPFVLLVATEWVLGIALYIAFFALVKTSGFAYVKGLLGF